MPAPEQQALSYLVPRPGAFWRWSADGQAITWTDGRTIAFRQEIEPILARLAPQGLPPFGALVLLLAACRDVWAENPDHRALLLKSAQTTVDASAGIVSSTPLSFPSSIAGRLQSTLEQVWRGLDQVAALPPELRQSVSAKVVLVETVFETVEKQLDPVASAAVAEALQNGLAAEALLNLAEEGQHQKLLTLELDGLLLGLPHVDAERLALRNRTGLEQLVEPAEVDLTPVQQVGALVTRLLRDEQLAPLARLARNLMAAVHIPRHLSDPEELPLGGVSDLTNRGPLDRLLISELAHDDLTLATRIALNEALYLRHESPAASPSPQRALLLDSGIRMWGIPRLFGAAVALALTATADRHAGLAVYRAHGDGVDEVEPIRRELHYQYRCLRLGLGFFTNRFINANLQVTYRCNFACQICDFWKEAHDPAKELSLDDVRLIGQKLNRLGTLIISLAGGEPLIRADLCDIVGILNKANHFPILITNGWFVEEPLAKDILRAGLQEISVSVDYVDPARHDAQRGQTGAWERAMRALDLLNRNRPDKRNRVHMISVLMDDNLDDVEKLILLARDLGVTYMLSLYSWNRGAKPRRLPGSKVTQHLLALKAKYPEFITLTSYIEQMDRAIADGGIGDCQTGRLLMNIDNHGNVSRCTEMLDRPVGNILTDDIGGIRRQLADRQRHEACAQCWTSCRGFAESITRPPRLRQLREFYVSVKPRA